MTRFEAFEKEERSYLEEAKRWAYLGRDDLERLYKALANSAKTHRLGLTVEKAEEAIWNSGTVGSME